MVCAETTSLRAYPFIKEGLGPHASVLRIFLNWQVDLEIPTRSPSKWQAGEVRQESCSHFLGRGGEQPDWLHLKVCSRKADLQGTAASLDPLGIW